MREYGPDTSEARPNDPISCLLPPFRPRTLAPAKTAVHDTTIDVSTSPEKSPKARTGAHAPLRAGSSLLRREAASTRFSESRTSRTAPSARASLSIDRFWNVFLGERNAPVTSDKNEFDKPTRSLCSALRQ